MNTQDKLIDIIKQNFPSVNAAKLDINLPLEQQGLDSLDMTTLLFAVEGAFGQAIPTAKVSALRSLQDIAAFLE